MYVIIAEFNAGYILPLPPIQNWFLLYCIWNIQAILTYRFYWLYDIMPSEIYKLLQKLTQ